MNNNLCHSLVVLEIYGKVIKNFSQRKITLNILLNYQQHFTSKW